VNSITDSPVIIQTSPSSVPSTPSWFGEVVVIAHALRRMGVLVKISQQVRFARRRFGCYEVIDFPTGCATRRASEILCMPGSGQRDRSSVIFSIKWPQTASHGKEGYHD